MGIQDFGPVYDREKFYRAREVARSLTYELSALIHAGMGEEDGLEIYRSLLSKYPIDKQWHPPKIRFGPNTLKNFRDPSDPYLLQEEDIFFIDIGPVVGGHEADYGETFVIGSHFEHRLIAEAARTIFSEVSHYWQQTELTGAALYQFAEDRARARGLIFNRGSLGHRIGDFPHQIFFKGKIPDCQEQLVPDAWILEIHLFARGMKYGAFFEDVLA